MKMNCSLMILTGRQKGEYDHDLRTALISQGFTGTIGIYDLERHMQNYMSFLIEGGSYDAIIICTAASQMPIDDLIYCLREWVDDETPILVISDQQEVLHAASTFGEVISTLQMQGTLHQDSALLASQLKEMLAPGNNPGLAAATA